MSLREIYDEPLTHPQQRKTGIALVKQVLNWQPKVKLDEGLKKTVK